MIRVFLRAFSFGCLRCYTAKRKISEAKLIAFKDRMSQTILRAICAGSNLLAEKQMSPGEFANFWGIVTGLSEDCARCERNKPVVHNEAIRLIEEEEIKQTELEAQGASEKPVKKADVLHIVGGSKKRPGRKKE